VALVATIAFLPSQRADADRKDSAYETLDEQATQLRNDFNEARGSVRALFVVDPTCPGCLRGLDDVNKSLLSKTNDARLQTFVVHVPVLKPTPTATDVPKAATLLSNDHVHHYWNPSGDFGRLLSNALDLKNDGEPVYAWDVWLVYGPDATWEGTAPPAPQLFMHQLRALEGQKLARLDSDVLARDVQGLLAKLPAATLR
jgi:hypothetical protein